MLNLSCLPNATRFSGTIPSQDPNVTIRTVYKIRRNSDGAYSRGGSSADVYDYDWVQKKGKEWTGRGPIINHLHQYGAGIPQDWTVEEYQQVTFRTPVQTLPARQFYGDKPQQRQDQQRRDAFTRQRIAVLREELARLEND